MADTHIPSSLVIADFKVFGPLAEVLGISQALPIQREGAKYSVSEKEWNRFAQQFGRNRLPAYHALFKARGNDSDLSSLSKKDLEPMVLQIAERNFAEIHGYPQAIIQSRDESGVLYTVRTKEGSYFQLIRDPEGRFTFKELEKEKGREMEVSIANMSGQSINHPIFVWCNNLI